MRNAQIEKSCSIFISHFSDEAPIAVALKGLLETAFSDALHIFVSSDYESIKSGEEFFNAIIGGVKRAKVVIVLLSRESVLRPWINFESGLGKGSAGLVIPVVIRNYFKSNVPPPLNNLQLRDIHDSRDLDALVRDAGDALEMRPRDYDVEAFIGEIKVIEKDIPYKGLYLEPYLETRDDGHFIIQFRIVNNGTLDMKLLAVEASAPQDLFQKNWGKPTNITNLFETREIQFEGKKYLRCKFNQYDGPISPGYGQGGSRLPCIISPDQSPMEIGRLRYAMRRELLEEELDLKIITRVYAEDFKSETHEFSIRDLLGGGRKEGVKAYKAKGH